MWFKKKQEKPYVKPALLDFYPEIVLWEKDDELIFEDDRIGSGLYVGISNNEEIIYRRGDNLNVESVDSRTNPWTVRKRIWGITNQTFKNRHLIDCANNSQIMRQIKEIRLLLNPKDDDTKQLK